MSCGREMVCISLARNHGIAALDRAVRNSSPQEVACMSSDARSKLYLDPNISYHEKQENKRPSPIVVIRFTTITRWICSSVIWVLYAGCHLLNIL